ncbi:YVTN repeat-like/Quino protein amine dehydrogenase [Panus rudis PR-1116 ss-1]|nr:YVTN repeat-like/Quino protein amine dehydrogenase [Panus rudis PR-1116 ss-1]
MDFTEIYKQSAGIVAFSPGAHFILTAVQERLVIRRADTFQITRTWHATSEPAPNQSSSSSKEISAQTAAAAKSSISSDSWITHASWSCDSEYVLAACARRNVVNVFKLRDESWSARLDAGVEGLIRAEWAPDGRSIICFSNWGLRVTIWSLVSGAATYIRFPLHPDRGYAFRADGRYFILAERHKSKDTLGVYDTTDSFRLVRHFPLPTSALSSLSLSPNGNHVAVWEGMLEYKLHIVSLTGDVLGSFAPKPDPGLGIRSVSWHPSGFFLVTSGWDDKIYTLERLTWSPVATFELHSRIPAGVTIWQEPADWIEKTEGRGFISYERLRPPHLLSIVRPDLTKPNVKAGASILSFNISGTLLLAKYDSCPNAVFLYSFPSAAEGDIQTRPAGSPSTRPTLRSVLLHRKPVIAARWNPVRKESLALCCGDQSIYLWSDEWISENDDDEDHEMAECVGVPSKQAFEVRDIQWAPDGKGLVLLDKQTFCCAFEVEDDSA